MSVTFHKFNCETDIEYMCTQLCITKTTQAKIDQCADSAILVSTQVLTTYTTGRVFEQREALFM